MLLVWQATILDEQGNVVPGAVITVRDQLTGTIVPIYADRDGATPKSNPFNADDEAYVKFFAGQGRYRIDAVSGSYSRTWQDVSLGVSGDDIQDALDDQGHIFSLTPLEVANDLTAADVNFGYLPGDIRRYKGDNTGTVDATAAIQTAFDVSYTVYVEGRFKCSGATATSDGLKIIGANRDSGFVATDGTVPCIILDGTRQMMDSIFFTCDISLADDTEFSFCAVKLTGSRTTLSRIAVQGYFTRGLWFNDALYTSMKDSFIEGFTKWGVTIDGGTFTKLENCMIFDASAGANDIEALVRIQNAPSVELVDCHITRGVGYAVYADASVPLNNYIYIKGCDVDYLENKCLRIEGYWDVHVEGNWLAGGQASGVGQVLIKDAYKVYFGYNSVDGSLGTSEGVVFEDCSSGTVHGNCVQYNVTNIVIDGCTNMTISENKSGQITGLPPTGSVTTTAFLARNITAASGCYWINNHPINPTTNNYSGIPRECIVEPGLVASRSNGDAYFKTKSVYIGNDDAASTSPRTLNFRTQHNNVYGTITGGYDDTNRGQIVFDGLGIGVDNCAIRFYTRNGSGIAERMQITPGGVTQPGADNTLTLGSGSFRWSQLYAGTATINTSDEREKQDIKPIDDAILDAWEKVEYMTFRFKDSVERKGDKARVHVGVIAQRVETVFREAGLDPFALGILCFDTWEETPERVVSEEQVNPVTGKVTPAIIDPARPAGDRYGVRYEQAFALEAALMRRELSRLKQRVSEG